MLYFNLEMCSITIDLALLLLYSNTNVWILRESVTISLKITT